MLAAWAVVNFYRELTPPLAEAYHIPYPVELERLMLDRFEAIGKRERGSIIGSMPVPFCRLA